jgi:hypothetical protein
MKVRELKRRLAPLSSLIIAGVNLIGWLLERLNTSCTAMPHRIRLLCEKPRQDRN